MEGDVLLKEHELTEDVSIGLHCFLLKSMQTDVLLYERKSAKFANIVLYRFQTKPIQWGVQVQTT